jgi:hypothetical protein
MIEQICIWQYFALELGFRPCAQIGEKKSILRLASSMLGSSWGADDAMGFRLVGVVILPAVKTPTINSGRTGSTLIITNGRNGRLVLCCAHVSPRTCHAIHARARVKMLCVCIYIDMH